ncbi:MAG: flippase [Lachnospiraceae bacterium]|nr:flippase [Lachnospiraceae bacterium]
MMKIKIFLGKIKKNKFIANTNWLLFKNIYSMLLSLVVGSLSVRYLGPSNYGLIGYGTSLVSLFNAISQLGLNSIIMSELLRKPEEKGKTLGTALVMRLVASIVSFLCVLLFVCIVEPGNQVLFVVTALQALVLICNTYELLNEWFLSELQSKVYVVASSIGATIVGGWKILLLVLGASVQWFAASTTIQALVCGGIIFVIFFKKKQFRLGYSFSRAREIFGKSKHYIISGLAIALYTQMDKVMLGKMMGEREVGLYTSAMTVAMLWEFVPQSIINSARAVILEKKNVNNEEYLRLFRILLLCISLMGIGVGVGIQLFGKWVILLLYGRAYKEAVPLLQILIWSTSFAMLGTARGIWNVAEDKNQYVKYYTIIGGLFNLFFNYFAIQVWGMAGAAVGTLLSQMLVSLGSPMFWKDTRPFVKLYMSSWKYMTQLKMLLMIQKKK